MKKSGIINAELSEKIAALAHMELFMIGDAGMPIPKGVEVIDLALISGVPSFIQVFDAIINEVVIEYYYLAEEIYDNNEFLYKHISKSLDNVEYETMPHTELKQLSRCVKFAVRTGEYSPYPNVILRAGVAFGGKNE